MHSEAFKKARLQLHSNNFSLKEVCSSVKNFITKTVAYEALNNAMLYIS